MKQGNEMYMHTFCRNFVLCCHKQIWEDYIKMYFRKSMLCWYRI